jgi:transcriptional repressor NrdR
VQVEEMAINSDREISTRTIGECIMEKLKDMDKVAYVRFASVYLDFKSLEEFLDELHGLLKKED